MVNEIKKPELSTGTGKSSPVGSCKPGILIADDTGLILTMLKFELELRGFNVWLAVDGDNAIALYRRNREDIALVLIDVQMPGLDGPQTLTALQKLDPDVLACFMTGNPGSYTKEDLQDLGAAYVFNKPFRPNELAQFLKNVVDCKPKWRLQ